ncbi:hypothetical protein OROMI_010359 [Orobanche minor]
MTTMMISNVSNGAGNVQNTCLTKVFVGGLAWETPKETLREHFDKYGHILEAVIISDKLTGRSKGYGFVTFKDVESAKKACVDPAPIINGRRANCNLASLGGRRPRSSSTAPTNNSPPQQGVNIGPRVEASTPPPPNPFRYWYYPTGTTAAVAAHPFHGHSHDHQAIPFYGYSPAYIATTDMNYNHMGFTGGSYMSGHFGQMYPGQAMLGANPLMPMYPLYHYHHHQSQTMGLPAHIYSHTATGLMPTVPGLVSKPISIAPPSAVKVCLAVE